MSEFFIFTNVGTPGAIGGDSVNRWEDDHFQWHHKKNSHLGWPSVRKLVDAGRAHIFWRTHNQELFEYAGYGTTVDVLDTTPVKFVWSFGGGSESDLLQRLEEIARRRLEETGLPHDLEVGHRVRHPELGVGRVLDLSGQYGNDLVTVFFASMEERQVLAVSEVEKVPGFGPS